MIRQFGLYPRFFIKKWDLLQPLMVKYANEDIATKSQGQRIKLYFQLIKNNPEFRAEVDALIEAQGGKLFTIQQRLAGKKMNIGKAKAKNGQSNFLNASEATTSDLSEGTEAEFIAAVEYEQKQEVLSGGLKIAGVVLIGLVAWYAYKKFIK